MMPGIFAGGASTAGPSDPPSGEYNLTETITPLSPTGLTLNLTQEI